jgi:hypothetical protein
MEDLTRYTAFDLPPRNFPQFNVEFAGLDFIFFGFSLGKRVVHRALQQP